MKNPFRQSCQTLRKEILKTVKTALKALVNIYKLIKLVKAGQETARFKTRRLARLREDARDAIPFLHPF